MLPDQNRAIDVPEHNAALLYDGRDQREVRCRRVSGFLDLTFGTALLVAVILFETNSPDTLWDQRDKSIGNINPGVIDLMSVILLVASLFCLRNAFHKRSEMGHVLCSIFSRRSPNRAVQHNPAPPPPIEMDDNGNNFVPY